MAGNMETLRLLYLALGPGIALAVYIYYSDKWEPEPKALVIKSFLLGGLACFPSYFFEDTFLKVLGWEGITGSGNYSPWWHIAVYAFFGVALAEELCKFLFLKAFIYDSREFSEPFDGIVTEVWWDAVLPPSKTFFMFSPWDRKQELSGCLPRCPVMLLKE